MARYLLVAWKDSSSSGGGGSGDSEDQMTAVDYQ